MYEVYLGECWTSFGVGVPVELPLVRANAEGQREEHIESRLPHLRKLDCPPHPSDCSAHFFHQLKFNTTKACRILKSITMSSLFRLIFDEFARYIPILVFV